MTLLAALPVVGTATIALASVGPSFWGGFIGGFLGEVVRDSTWGRRLTRRVDALERGPSATASETK